MTLSEIDRKRRTLPVFVKAIATEHALTAAIALETRHAHRLRTLRGKVSRHIRHANEAQMSQFMHLYGPSFDYTIAAAYHAIERCEDAEAMACERVTVGMAVAA